jgi:hypothetical protein
MGQNQKIIEDSNGHFGTDNTVGASEHYHSCDQIPDRNNLREEIFVFLMFSEVSVHYDEGVLMEHLTSW